MTRSLMVALLLAFMAAAGTGAVAATWTQSFWYPGPNHPPVNLSDYAPLTPPTYAWTYNFAPQQFNPLLGTLDLVRVNMTAFQTSTVKVENQLNAARGPMSGQIGAVAVLDLPWQAGAAQAISASTLSVSTLAANTTGVNDWVGYDSITWSYNQLKGNSPGQYQAPPPAGDLVLWTGTGTVPISVYAFWFGDLSGFANCWVDGTTVAAVDINVEYVYTPAGIVPEMGSLMLAGLGGFVGLPLFRRFRK